MPDFVETKDIFKAFTSVGFSTPFSWLKPYEVLSNGEKMRVDLARCLLSNKDVIVFDEFTSVVDRNVAAITSLSIQKNIRKNDKRFIAVACHFDIIDWLEPDWIFDTNTMTFHTGRQKKNVSIRLDVIETTRKKHYWEIFRRYHYLSHSHHNTARVFVCFANDVLCGFCSVINFPHPKAKNLYAGHRSVILPDYQGVGIGTAFTDFVADVLKKEGKVMISTTTNPAMIYSRVKNKKWICTRFSRSSNVSNKSTLNMKKQSSSINRITASFRYVG